MALFTKNQLLNDLLTGLVPLPQPVIWVADDNADVRLLLSRAFKRFFPPVPVEYFSDGSGVLEGIRRGTVRPKLLLLDLEMPSVNGIQTIESLAAEGYTRGITIMLFSTLAEPAVVEHAYDSGAHFFLQKPVGGEEFRDLAKLCLKCLDVAEGLGRFPITSRSLNVSTALAALEVGAKRASGSPFGLEHP